MIIFPLTLQTIITAQMLSNGAGFCAVLVYCIDVDNKVNRNFVGL